MPSEKKFEIGNFSQELPDRLAKIRKELGISQRKMAEILGISHKGWQAVESGGSVPGGHTISRLIQLGFDANWILSGKGSMRNTPPEQQQPYKWALTDQAPMNLDGMSQQPFFSLKTNIIDPILLGKITDTIAAVYKECNARISPRDLGTLGGEKYSEIVTTSDDPEERLVMVKFLATQLRKELLSLVIDTSGDNNPQTRNENPPAKF